VDAVRRTVRESASTRQISNCLSTSGRRRVKGKRHWQTFVGPRAAALTPCYGRLAGQQRRNLKLRNLRSIATADAKPPVAGTSSSGVNRDRTGDPCTQETHAGGAIGTATRPAPEKLVRNWYEAGAARAHRPTKKPRLSGAFPYSGGGIRTRDLRVMRWSDGSALRHIWLCRAILVRLGAPWFCSDCTPICTPLSSSRRHALTRQLARVRQCAAATRSSADAGGGRCGRAVSRQ
jgi:hypothetical protein